MRYDRYVLPFRPFPDRSRVCASGISGPFFLLGCWPASGCSRSPRLSSSGPGPAGATGGLLEIETVLSGLPNNAAWQGVANDGIYFYLLTSQNTSKDIPNAKENIIRKYRMSDGQLVAVKNDAYPNARRFSSGEVFDGKLYVAVRDAGVTSTWAHVIVYDTTDFTVLEDHDIAAAQGYAVPEGVAKEDGYFWVIFGGAGGGFGNAMVSAVVKYDLAWNRGSRPTSSSPFLAATFSEAKISFGSTTTKSSLICTRTRFRAKISSTAGDGTVMASPESPDTTSSTTMPRARWARGHCAGRVPVFRS